MSSLSFVLYFPILYFPNIFFKAFFFNRPNSKYKWEITSRDFTDGSGVEAVRVVAVSRLNEDGGVGQAVSKDLSIDVAQLNA